jgi:aerobic carbon-monoxide dehydrogenase small subunit
VQRISLTLNGREIDEEVEERTLLLEFVREVVGLTGTHNGCMEARCGCCIMLLDGAAVKSCNVLAIQADGHSVTTIEGVAPQGRHELDPITSEALAGVYKPLSALAVDGQALHPLQQAFHDKGALQCGFCTPGMIMVLRDFLEQNPRPSAEEVRVAISGNLCRCTGYQKIVEAALQAADVLAEQD